MKTIKLIDLWFLDDNFNEPVKTRGFKSLIKSDFYCISEDGYVFIEPGSVSFMVTGINDNHVFETEKDANDVLKSQENERIEFAKKQVKHYSEFLQSIKN
jgi:hypothetical protein